MLELFLVFISSLGMALPFLVPGLSFLAWFSLVPLFFLLPGKISLKKSFFFLFFGAVYYGLIIHWIVHVTYLGFVFLLFYLSLFYLLFYLLGSFFIRRPLKQLTIPVAWVIIEFLKEIIWCGFGWANLGYSQFQNIYLIQVADIGGAKAISFLIVLVNFLIWEGIVSLRKKKYTFSKTVLVRIVFIVLIFTVMVTYSFFRLKQSGAEEKINISIIQPNIPGRYFLNEKEKKEAVRSLLALAGETPRKNLVIFSEAAWPYTVNQQNLWRFNKFAQQTQRNILIGAINQRKQNYYNSAFFFSKKGDLIQTYDKIILVPFGEYVPLRRYLTFIEVLNQLGDITPGEEMASFSYEGKKFAVLICFEDIVPFFTSEIARNKDFLVNITDDSWFEGNPQAKQHLSIMVLRAVENRIPIVRAANTGFSGWVSAQGKIEKLEKKSAGLFVRGGDNFEVSLRRERSFYNKNRKWLILFSFIFPIGVALEKKLKSFL